ncbi:unnamed protein product [Phyllotreta striolata]|uniref:Thaumatin-like protein n=1 Tax=Phyllotreta striolata TaxID=444603 RepID=A0A9N9TI63_PHYSR|nr:unnamed protein product [Phyllotreta striolata]
MYQLLALLVCLSTAQAVQFQIRNHEKGPVWVGIQGNPGHPHLENGGFVLNEGQEKTVNAPENWAGRFWGRTYCNSQSNHCGTGDCGNKLQCSGAGGVPPASLAEITLKGDKGLDFYDISFVDGFNIPISFGPQGGVGDGSKYSCQEAQCKKYLNDQCPNELKLNEDGKVIGCKSACLAFNTDEYCCRGAHGTSETCKSSDWPKDYPKYFKTQCPDAYSYAYDDHKSTFTCRAEKYTITFGV